MRAVAAPTDLTQSCTYSDTVSVELSSDEATETAIKEKLAATCYCSKGPFSDRPDVYQTPNGAQIEVATIT